MRFLTVLSGSVVVVFFAIASGLSFDQLTDTAWALGRLLAGGVVLVVVVLGVCCWVLVVQAFIDWWKETR